MFLLTTIYDACTNVNQPALMETFETWIVNLSLQILAYVIPSMISYIFYSCIMYKRLIKKLGLLFLKYSIYGVAIITFLWNFLLLDFIFPEHEPFAWINSISSTMLFILTFLYDLKEKTGVIK